LNHKEEVKNLYYEKLLEVKELRRRINSSKEKIDELNTEISNKN